MVRNVSRTIILADPPLTEFRAHSSAFPNLGLLYVAAALRQRFGDCAIRYLDCRVPLADHLAVVRQTAPAVYGLSFATPYTAAALRVIDAAKAASPLTTVICGGAHPTSDPESVLRDSAADAVCLGEGEITAVEFVDAVLHGRGFENIPGIACRTAGGSVARNEARPLVASLDDLPHPAWDLVDFERFTGARTSRCVRAAAIVASRGCPFDCVFCSNPVWKLATPWYRKRSDGDIAAEVEELYGRGVREIYIRSDEMNVDLDWAIGVFETLAGLGHEDLVFQCNLRATPVTPALVDAMARARCWLCRVGVESASQRVLDGVKKHVALADVPPTFALLKSRGIKTFAYFMLFQAWEDQGRLCVESTAEVMRSIRWIIALRRQRLLDYISWAFATPYPGAALYHTARKFGLMRATAARRDVLLPWDISMDLPGISRWEMAGMRTLGMLLQGALLLSDPVAYRPHAVVANARAAAERLRYATHV